MFKDLFRKAAKAGTLRAAGTPRPKARRRKSGDDTREHFPRAWRAATMRAPAASYAAAKAYLADTLDWLNLWHNTAQLGSDAPSSYNANHNNNNYTGGFSP